MAKEKKEKKDGRILFNTPKVTTLGVAAVTSIFIFAVINASIIYLNGNKKFSRGDVGNMVLKLFIGGVGGGFFGVVARQCLE